MNLNSRQIQNESNSTYVVTFLRQASFHALCLSLIMEMSPRLSPVHHGRVTKSGAAT